MVTNKYFDIKYQFIMNIISIDYNNITENLQDFTFEGIKSIKFLKDDLEKIQFIYINY